MTAWVRIAQRIRTLNLWVKSGNPVSQLRNAKTKKEFELTNSKVISSLRRTCQTMGGKDYYRYYAKELGLRSIQSWAVMPFFLTRKYSTEHIMALGQWRSQAFLSYIRSQTMKWTNLIPTNPKSSRTQLWNWNSLQHCEMGQRVWVKRGTQCLTKKGTTVSSQSKPTRFPKSNIVDRRSTK